MMNRVQCLFSAIFVGFCQDRIAPLSWNTCPKSGVCVEQEGVTVGFLFAGAPYLVAAAAHGPGATYRDGTADVVEARAFIACSIV